MKKFLHKYWLTCLTLGLVACSGGDKQSLNRLSTASSPYLREHADNPVHWFEWGDEALEKAKRENKPIIVSIGYASCHWCHVMEEESFMDTTVARIMNENFIAIKVDREERPDIDQVYIDAAQLITGRAGWPLNAFGLPDGTPFYAATYFPKEQWIGLLQQVITAYKEDKENVDKQANAVREGVLESSLISPLPNEAKGALADTYSLIFPSWESDFDYLEGGIKGAPKFPMPVVWEFLLQDFYKNNNEEALLAATTTLDKMAMGGIYDHLAGGFARYATDEEWKVPHFEKMLYDNGQLVSLYAHAYQVTRNETYATVVKETLEFVKQNLTASNGGFYSSLNADSEGEEGTFYVWTKPELQAILGANASPLFCEYFNVTEEGNWENKKNVLHTKTSVDDLAKQRGIKPEALHKLLLETRQTTLDARNKRIRPSVDDKILTSWNALMLSGYIDAYWALGDDTYLEAALKNAEFLKKHMIQSNGGLLRSYSNGRASIEAFLDDYAFLSSAFIQLYQATFDIQWLDQSKILTDFALEHFKDPETGFFFYTSDVSDGLYVRKLDIQDQVTPSSNAVMAEVLFTLGRYYENASYQSVSSKMVQSLSPDFRESGPYFAQWASVMGLMAFQTNEVAVMGPEAMEKARQIMQSYHPDALLMGGNEENLPLLENKLVEGKTIIYVCQDKICKLPVQDVAQALKQMKGN